ncbi:MAG: serine-type D-Ala-D-Ala carboxypeptidase, partial [Gammaproteobacteria bacterium]
LALLGAALIRDFPEIYSWHSVKEFTFNDIRQTNRNELLWRDASVDGIKTGHTETAGYCLIVSAQRDGTRVITVVMGTDGPKARLQATESLLNFVFRFYETRRLFSAGDVVTNSKVWKGAAESLRLGIQSDLFVTVPRGAYGQLDAAAQVSGTVIAPVEKGSVHGSLVVRLEGEPLYERPLVALESVPEGGIFVRLKDEIRLLFH